MRWKFDYEKTENSYRTFLGVWGGGDLEGREEYETINTLKTSTIFWPRESITLLEVPYASSARPSENSSVRMNRVRNFVSLVNTELRDLEK